MSKSDVVDAEVFPFFFLSRDPCGLLFLPFDVQHAGSKKIDGWVVTFVTGSTFVATSSALLA